MLWQLPARCVASSQSLSCQLIILLAGRITGYALDYLRSAGQGPLASCPGACRQLAVCRLTGVADPPGRSRAWQVSTGPSARLIWLPRTLKKALQVATCGDRTAETHTLAADDATDVPLPAVVACLMLQTASPAAHRCRCVLEPWGMCRLQLACRCVTASAAHPGEICCIRLRSVHPPDLGYFAAQNWFPAAV